MQCDADTDISGIFARSCNCPGGRCIPIEGDVSTPIPGSQCVRGLVAEYIFIVAILIVEGFAVVQRRQEQDLRLVHGGSPRSEQVGEFLLPHGWNICNGYLMADSALRSYSSWACVYVVSRVRFGMREYPLCCYAESAPAFERHPKGRVCCPKVVISLSCIARERQARAKPSQVSGSSSRTLRR